MTSANKPVEIPTQAEELLAALEGVISAHVVSDPAGRIVEIHVLARADLHPKQVVRNVESALTAGLGVTIDRRVVSVAQIRSDPAEVTVSGSGGGGAGGAGGGGAGGGGGGAVPEANGRSGTGSTEIWEPEGASADAEPGARGRLEYVRYESRRDAGTCACEVVLRDGRSEFRGRGKGGDTVAGRAEAAAAAVLAAIERARPEVRLALEGATVSSVRRREFVIVSAQLLQDRGPVPLSGAAPIARSPEEAAILAALQATNRWSA